MTGLRTLWRRLGGFSAVLLAFAVMFAPVADAAACANERPAAASEQAHGGAAATSEALAVASDDHRSVAPDMGGDLGLCQHGHCHHATPYPSVLATEIPVPTAGSPPVDQLPTQPVRLHWASRLERPPRA